MTQLGNLAIVCAKRPDVSLTISMGAATLTVWKGDRQAQFTAGWQDNVEIERLIQELNFGSLRVENTNG